MQRLWLIFAQTVTVALAILFVVTTLKPEWLPQRQAVVALQQAPVSDFAAMAALTAERGADSAIAPEGESDADGSAAESPEGQ